MVISPHFSSVTISAHGSSWKMIVSSSVSDDHHLSSWVSSSPSYLIVTFSVTPRWLRRDINKTLFVSPFICPFRCLPASISGSIWRVRPAPAFVTSTFRSMAARPGIRARPGSRATFKLFLLVTMLRSRWLGVFISSPDNKRLKKKVSHIFTRRQLF